MKVSSKYDYALRKDSVTSLNTAGVLGETYVDIDSSQTKLGPRKMATFFPFATVPIARVVRSSQSTLETCSCCCG